FFFFLKTSTISRIVVS
ncbi:hypothetical protein MPH_14054, partial [Macrophomina phaseolina MS6]